MTRVLWSFGGAIVLLVCVGAGAILFGGAASPAARPYLQGVDVARYQGQIDWRELAGDNVAFAFIKATEGGDYVDPLFERNWREARRAGVLRGAYHFFTLCRPGRVQAEHFLTVVGDMRGALTPALDAEHMGACRLGGRVSDPVLEITSFLDTVEKATGKRPIIYTTHEFYTAYFYAVPRMEKFWLRSLYVEPGYGPEEWVFWQHSGRGRRRGIAGPVDLNAFRGTQSDLEALVLN